MTALNPVLDRSFLVATPIENDKHHESAQQILGLIRAGEWDHLILSDHVLSETITVIQARADHVAASRFADALLESQQVTFVIAGEDVFEALRVFTSEKDSGLSFVDCVLVHHARAYSGPIACFDGGLQKMRGLQVVP